MTRCGILWLLVIFGNWASAQAVDLSTPYCKSPKYLEYADQLKDQNQTDLLARVEAVLANCGNFASPAPSTRLLEINKSRKLVAGSPDVDNGDFSSGFTSWTTDAQGFGLWLIQDPFITSSPSSGYPWAPPPFPSERAANVDMSGPAMHVLYQDFTVPAAGVVSATISFDYQVQNFANVWLQPISLPTDFYNGGPVQWIQVDLYRSAGVGDFDLPPANLVQTLWTPALINNAFTTGLTEYAQFSVDVTTAFNQNVGQTLRLRFFEVDNQFFNFLGISNVQIQYFQGGLTADPHLVGANGARFDFDGQLGAAYTLFSGPQFQINMRIAGDGPKPHFMTEVGVLFRNESFLFTVVTMDKAFRNALQAKLARVGGRLLKFRHWEVVLELCPGQRVTITQKHTTEAERELWHADGRPFYYLDMQVAVPDCDDAYDGVLGQTYQCKYVQRGAPFEWSHAQEEAYRLPGDDLTSAGGTLVVDAPCFGIVDGDGSHDDMSKDHENAPKQHARPTLVAQSA